jgi:dTDP-4-dehydrorhamnose 3,5-epimerase
MKINKTFIEDLLIIEPQLFEDDRGFFYESYNKKTLDKNIVFVQDNESKSVKGVIRGLHFQIPPFEQTKLVRCVSGNILDVVVDLRSNSKTYGIFFSIELSSENNKQLFIPRDLLMVFRF